MTEIFNAMVFLTKCFATGSSTFWVLIFEKFNSKEVTEARVHLG
jgi:hypothetical protein